MILEMLTPNLFVSRHGRRAEVLFRVGQINRLPKISDAHILSEAMPVRLLRVDRQHELVAEQLHGPCIRGVMLVIFHAQPFGTLYALLLTVYNFTHVIPDEKCTRCFVDVALLNPAHW